MRSEDIQGSVALLLEHAPDHDAGEWVERLARDVASADRHPVVAVLDGAVIGYSRTMPFQADAGAPANAAPSGYYLLGLVVAPARRRHGVGRLLTEERLRWLSLRGCDSVFYYTHKDNNASQRLHDQLGFRWITDDFWFPALTSGHEQVLYGLHVAAGPVRD